MHLREHQGCTRIWACPASGVGPGGSQSWLWRGGDTREQYPQAAAGGASIRWTTSSTTAVPTVFCLRQRRGAARSPGTLALLPWQPRTGCSSLPLPRQPPPNVPMDLEGAAAAAELQPGEAQHAPGFTISNPADMTPQDQPPTGERKALGGLRTRLSTPSRCPTCCYCQLRGGPSAARASRKSAPRSRGWAGSAARRTAGRSHGLASPPPPSPAAAPSRPACRGRRGCG